MNSDFDDRMDQFRMSRAPRFIGEAGGLEVWWHPKENHYTVVRPSRGGVSPDSECLTIPADQARRVAAMLRTKGKPTL